MRNITIIFPILISTIFSSNSYSENEKIRIGWVYAMANAPVIIAQEKGYLPLNKTQHDFNGKWVAHAARSLAGISASHRLRLNR